jgi:hypothetical protein
MDIGGYSWLLLDFFNGYWWLFMVIVEYFINEYWWLFMAIVGYFLMDIGGYSWLLVVILL